jgi:hypothetical protein
LLTPLGLRSLAPNETGYTPYYGGGVRERDGAYHQGTVWPWLIGPFVEAWVRIRGNTPDAKREARSRFLDPLLYHLWRNDSKMWSLREPGMLTGNSQRREPKGNHVKRSGLSGSGAAL